MLMHLHERWIDIRSQDRQKYGCKLRRILDVRPGKDSEDFAVRSFSSTWLQKLKNVHFLMLSVQTSYLHLVWLPKILEEGEWLCLKLSWKVCNQPEKRAIKVKVAIVADSSSWYLLCCVAQPPDPTSLLRVGTSVTTIALVLYQCIIPIGMSRWILLRLQH